MCAFDFMQVRWTGERYGAEHSSKTWIHDTDGNKVFLIRLLISPCSVFQGKPGDNVVENRSFTMWVGPTAIRDNIAATPRVGKVPTFCIVLNLLNAYAENKAVECSIKKIYFDVKCWFSVYGRVRNEVTLYTDYIDWYKHHLRIRVGT